jgi:hypothetical protein
LIVAGWRHTTGSIGDGSYGSTNFEFVVAQADERGFNVFSRFGDLIGGQSLHKRWLRVESTECRDWGSQVDGEALGRAFADALGLTESFEISTANRCNQFLWLALMQKR